MLTALFAISAGIFLYLYIEADRTKIMYKLKYNYLEEEILEKLSELEKAKTVPAVRKVINDMKTFLNNG